MKYLKPFLCSIASHIFFELAAFAQTFSTCPDAYVIGYKEGTSCTASAYNLYQIDATTGVLAPTPFYTHPSTSEEINGICINSNDQYLYGILYSRSVGCTFSNFQLFRLTSTGILTSLGVIDPPVEAGFTGTVDAAMGTLNLNGNYFFRAFVVVGPTVYLKIGRITQTQLLSPAATITPEYFNYTQTFSGLTYADWAVHPVTGELYTYTISQSTANGQLAKFDLSTKTLSLTGAVTTGEFTDPVRDNFGGLFFGTDNNLYGVNVNTRNYYQIDPVTGTVTLINNIPSTAGGQIRTDMGGCTNGSFPLSLKIVSFSIAKNNDRHIVRLTTEAETGIDSIIVQQSQDGATFTTAGNWKPNNNNYTNKYILDLMKPQVQKTYYRVKVVQQTGRYFYSDVVVVTNDEASANSFQAIQPVSAGNDARFMLNLLQGGGYILSLTDMSGKKLARKEFELPPGRQTICISLPYPGTNILLATLQGQGAILRTKILCNQ